jgi:NADH-quinone oxidoreductase subunit C
MQCAEILEMLRQRFGPGVVGAGIEAIDPWIEVAPEALVDVCRFLRDEPALRFNMLQCITGVDYLQVDPKRKIEGQPRIEVMYHVLSLVHRHGLGSR